MKTLPLPRMQEVTSAKVNNVQNEKVAVFSKVFRKAADYKL